MYMSKILVTGWTGFIGSHIVDLFLEESVEKLVIYHKVLELVA